MAQDRLQTLGPLGVSGRNPMVEHPAIGEKTDSHRSSGRSRFARRMVSSHSLRSNHNRAAQVHNTTCGNRTQAFHVKRRCLLPAAARLLLESVGMKPNPPRLDSCRTREILVVIDLHADRRGRSTLVDRPAGTGAL